MSELDSLNHAFDEAAKHGHDPDNVHVHETTHRRLSADIYQHQAGKSEHEAKQLAASDPVSVVRNPHTGKQAKVLDDDVPEGRYFFSDKS